MSLFTEACKYIPGGVNSPVRAFRGVGGEPIFFARAKGSRAWAADGREFIDYVGSWGPMILGHAHPDVIRTVQQAAEHGLRDVRGFMLSHVQNSFVAPRKPCALLQLG